jgi:large conductance mechanosensitive channel
MFLVIRAMNRLEDNLEEAFGDDAAKPEEPETKKCPFCRTPIPFRAIRCPHCTSELARGDVLPPAHASEPRHGP